MIRSFSIALLLAVNVAFCRVQTELVEEAPTTKSSFKLGGLCQMVKLDNHPKILSIGHREHNDYVLPARVRIPPHTSIKNNTVITFEFGDSLNRFAHFKKLLHFNGKILTFNNFCGKSQLYF